MNFSSVVIGELMLPKLAIPIMVLLLALATAALWFMKLKTAAVVTGSLFLVIAAFFALTMPVSVETETESGPVVDEETTTTVPANP